MLKWAMWSLLIQGGVIIASVGTFFLTLGAGDTENAALGAGLLCYSIATTVQILISACIKYID